MSWAQLAVTASQEKAKKAELLCRAWCCAFEVVVVLGERWPCAAPFTKPRGPCVASRRAHSTHPRGITPFFFLMDHLANRLWLLVWTREGCRRELHSLPFELLTSLADLVMGSVGQDDDVG